MSCARLAAVFVLLLFVSASAYAQGATTRADAVASMQQAEKDIREMADAGFSVKFVGDTLTAAKQALERADFAELIRRNATGNLADEARKALEGLNYEGFNYGEVLKHTQEISLRKQRAYSLSDSIRAAAIRIGDYRSQEIDATAAETFLSDAKLAFEKERYDEAEVLLLKARSDLEDRRAELSTLNVIVESGKSYFVKNWPAISVAVVAVGLSAWFGWRLSRARRIRNRLRRLRVEKSVLIRLMKKAQVDRYETAEISESIYEIRMEKYNERMEEVKRTLPVLESMLKKDRFAFYFGLLKKPEKVVERKERETRKIKKTEKAEKPREPFWPVFSKALRGLLEEGKADRKILHKKQIRKKKILHEVGPEKSSVGFLEKLRLAFQKPEGKKRAEPKDEAEKFEAEAEETKIEIPRSFEKRGEEREAPRKPSPLSELIGRWKAEASRMEHEAQRRGALEKLYSGRRGYTFSKKSYKTSDIGLRIKRLIGKIRFKIS